MITSTLLQWEPGRHSRGVALLLLLLTNACGSPEQTAPPEPVASTPAPAAPVSQPLPAIVVPDITKLSPSAQTQIREAQAAVAAGRGAESERALAHGNLAKLLLAAGFRQAAEATFLHAESLAPADPRWPYYLGHVYYGNGDVVRAEAAFRRAQRLRQSDVPTLVWLARTQLDLGRPDLAEPLFEQARTAEPRAGAVLLGLGQVAIARRQFAQAIALLEDAASVDPEAGEIRYALATAYRLAGQQDRAQAQPQARAAEKVRLPDPLMEEVDTLLETGVAYEIRGGRALERRDWATAIDLFRKGIALAPDTPSLRQKLGTALSMSGDASGAMRQFEELVRRWPDYAKGQYSLGVMLAARGRLDDAARRFAAAAQSDPLDVQAHLQLAEARRVQSRFADAVPPYDDALRINPRLAAAHFGRAMALVGAKRYADAVRALSDATGLFPDQGAFPHATARLLAAAPADDVRNGQRALSILKGLGIEQRWTVPMAETMAMALAEAGRYSEAAKWQRDAMAEARTSGSTALIPRMAENLRLYEQGRPCRVPWGEELRFAAL